MTLKDSLQNNKLKDFIKSHKNDPKADKEQFDQLFKTIAKNQTKAPQTSSQDNS